MELRTRKPREPHNPKSAKQSLGLWGSGTRSDGGNFGKPSWLVGGFQHWAESSRFAGQGFHCQPVGLVPLDLSDWAQLDSNHCATADGLAMVGQIREAGHGKPAARRPQPKWRWLAPLTLESDLVVLFIFCWRDWPLGISWWWICNGSQLELGTDLMGLISPESAERIHEVELPCSKVRLDFHVGGCS